MVKQDIAIRSVSLCFVMQISVNLLIQARVVLETLNENIFKTAKKYQTESKKKKEKLLSAEAFKTSLEPELECLLLIKRAVVARHHDMLVFLPSRKRRPSVDLLQSSFSFYFQRNA